jgi:GNAT superfamily N-acetyltransferase
MSMASETITISRAELTSDVSRRLIDALNLELSGMYPEPGATHFGLDPAEVSGRRGAFLVVWRDGVLVGCGAVRLVDAQTGELKRMYVAPTVRGTGLGRRLVAALEAEGRALGARRLILETGIRQLAALALYKATGFMPIPLYGEYCLSPDTSICLGKELTDGKVAMPQLHPSTRAILVVFDNQLVRTTAALEGLTQANLDFAPGGDCQTIRGIIGHLLDLRAFQLFLLNSPVKLNVPKPQPSASLDQLLGALAAAATVVRREVETHDPDDWYAVPSTPRGEPWGMDPTLIRFCRPLNDFANHLGAIRAIRRMQENPAPRTQ